MTPAFGGELETLTVELNGRRRRITLERRGPWAAPLWLLLPALSTVSSRSEWQPLAEAVGDRRQLLSFDWPGFGESDRDAIPYSALGPAALILLLGLAASFAMMRTTETLASREAPEPGLDGRKDASRGDLGQWEKPF